MTRASPRGARRTDGRREDDGRRAPARALGWQYRDNDTETRAAHRAHGPRPRRRGGDGRPASGRVRDAGPCATGREPDVISASACCCRRSGDARAVAVRVRRVGRSQSRCGLADQFQRSRAPARHPQPTHGGLLRGAVRNTRTAVPRDRRLRAATLVRSRSRRAGRRDRVSAVRPAETGSQEGRH